MTRKSKLRSKWLTIRLSEEEEKKLHQYFGRTTARSLSEYSRDVLLKEPVTILYRNQSADDFLAEMIQLKRELKAIGNNFTQIPCTPHSVNENAAFKAWLLLAETHKRNFLKKLDEISERMAQIHKAWSQK